MKHIYILSIILASLLPPVAAWGQNSEYQQKKDSLLQVIHSTQGIEKLETYKKLCMLPIPPEDLDTYLKFSEDFIAEAQKQQNIDFESDARYDELTKLYNYNRKEDIKRKIDDYLNFFLKNEQWNNYYAACAIVIETYIFERKYEKAMQEAKRVYDMAKSRNSIPGIETASYYIGLVYANTERLDEAETYFRETLSLSDDDANFSNARRRAYEDLCRIMLKKKEYRQAIEMSEDLNKQYDKYFKANPSAIRNKQYASLIYFRINAEAYLGLNELEQAEHYCNLTEELASNDARAMSYIYLIRAQISEERKQYEKSIGEFDKALQFYEQIGTKPLPAVMGKARVLSKMGRGIEAYPMYEAAIERNAASVQSVLQSQLEELRTQYETDKHIAEKERNRNYFLFALAGCVFLAVIIAGYVVYSNRLRRKNLSLYRQIQENVRSEKEAAKILEIAPEQELSREMQLYRKLHTLMESEKPFIAPGFDRSALARLLGTNEKYLADAIQEGVGTTVATYISDCRLAHSLFLFAENPGMSLDTIAEKSGHGSYSAFFRAFIKKYGMSPSEYRKLSELSKHGVIKEFVSQSITK